MGDSNQNMVSFCHYSPTEPRTLLWSNGFKSHQNICLKCWRPCDLISADLVDQYDHAEKNKETQPIDNR